MTPSGIEPATCRFVAQCHNHQATARPVSIYIHCINWPFLITETEGLLRRELNLQIQLRLMAMAQAVSCRFLKVKSRVRSQTSSREIYGKNKSDTDTGFSPSTSVSPVSVTVTMLHIHLHLHVALTRRNNGRNLGPFQNAVFFRKSVSTGQKTTFTSQYLNC